VSFEPSLLWQRGECRPKYGGSRVACHAYAPELSGKAVPPTSASPSTPAIHLSLHAIGGICAVSKQLPLGPNAAAEVATTAIQGNGMNATFGDKVHCVAAEPHATFLSISVTDDGEEVAYETAVLGRLLRGYRVIQIRSALGTRIELACIFVHIVHSTESELNLRSTAQQTHVNEKLSEENEALKQKLVALESALFRTESFAE